MHICIIDSSPIDKKPLIREICWHQLLQQFISMSNDHVNNDQQLCPLPQFEKYKVVFQSSNNPVMLQRYTAFIQTQITSMSPELDRSMYDYSIQLIRICFQLARERKSIEYANLSDYLVLALQSIGIEKDLKDIIFGSDI